MPKRRPRGADVAAATEWLAAHAGEFRPRWNPPPDCIDTSPWWGDPNIAGWRITATGLIPVHRGDPDDPHVKYQRAAKAQEGRT